MGETQPAEAADNFKKDTTQGDDRVDEEIAQVGISLWVGWSCVWSKLAKKIRIKHSLSQFQPHPVDFS